MTRNVSRFLFAVGILLSAACTPAGAADEQSASQMEFEKATFAGGCFWCVESFFDKTQGVISTTSGYTGGHVPNPTYEQVSTGTTGHAESVELVFDPSKVTYSQLVDTFFKNIDPTAENQQFHDVGTQYRTVIFYHSEEQKRLAEAAKEALEKSGKFDKPIRTEIASAGEFYPAESYHQDYHAKNPLGYGRYSAASGRENFLKKTWGSKKD